MKTVHLNTYSTGGAAKACLRVVNALNMNGINSEMLVLYNTISEPHVSDFRDELSLLKNYELKVKNKLYVINHEAKFKNSEELFSAYDPVWDVNTHSLLKDADVINLHWVSGFVNFKNFLAYTKKKIVFTMHDFYPFSGGYHYPNAVFNTGKYAKAINENLNLLNNVYSKADVNFVSPSNYLRDKLMQSGLQFEIKCNVIKNPISSSVFFKQQNNLLRNKFGFSQSDKVIAYVNERLAYKRKGHYLFKQIFKQLIESGYKLLMIGEIDKDIQHPSVVQLGYVSSDKELNDYYNMADLLLYTSVDENLPNTIAESLCAGTPVVGFDIGGHSEMITNNVNGFLVKKDDLSGLLEKAKQLLNYPLNKTEISKTAHSVYSEELIANKYKAIYTNG